MKNVFKVIENITIIKLNNNKETIIDTEDLCMISKYNWCYHKERNNEYCCTDITTNNGRKRIRLHRLLINCDNLQVDHIDGNGLNNTKENLRACNNQQNNFNRGPNKKSTSKFKGVAWDKERNKWYACIRFNGKSYNLGRHDNEIDAAMFYNEAAIKFFGEFARLNNVKMPGSPRIQRAAGIK